MLIRRPFAGLREAPGLSLSNRSMSAWHPFGGDTLGLPKGNAVLASLASENLMHASQALSSNRAPYCQLTRKFPRMGQPS